MHSDSSPKVIVPSAAVGIYFTMQLLNGFYNQSLYTNAPAAFWALDVITHAIVPVLLLGIIVLIAHVELSEIGIKIRDPSINVFDLVLLSLFLAIVLWPVYTVSVESWYYYVGGEPPDWHYGVATSDLGVMRPLVAIYMSLTAGIFEEIFYKGLLLYVLSVPFADRANNAIFVIVSSCLFSLVHWENGVAELIGTFVYQFIGSALYLKIRNVLPFIAAHYLIDIYHFW